MKCVPLKNTIYYKIYYKIYNIDSIIIIIITNTCTAQILMIVRVSVITLVRVSVITLVRVSVITLVRVSVITLVSP